MRGIRRSTVWASVFSLVLLSGCRNNTSSNPSPNPSPGPPAGPPSPAAACAALVGQTIGGATISTVSQAAATAQTPSHCVVKGAIHTTLHFEAILPTTTWNKKLVYYGGGGFDGVDPMLPRATGGYVSVASNGGHNDPTGNVFLDNPQAQTDFGYLSIHTVLQAMKPIMQQVYGVLPQRYYFEGCSNGGREALIQASRYPQDFDGIVASAPAYNFSQLGLVFNRNMKHMLGTPGGAIPIAKTGTVARAVLEKCDALDGLADHIVSRVEKCVFDPATLLCTAGDNNNCLTSQQVNTAKTIYAEFKLADGTLVYPGWGPSGEDQGWPLWLIGGTQPPREMFFSEPLIRSFFVKDATYDSLKFDPPSHRAQIAQTAKLLDASPDLRAFFAGQGKLLLVHGTSDWAISYKASIKYFNDVATAVGGAAQRDAAMEFFLEPSVQHCGGGTGPDSIDLLGAVVNWVERGQRPSSANPTIAKLDPAGKVAFARPLCRYPQYPRYNGTGDVNAPSSFTCTDP